MLAVGLIHTLLLFGDSLACGTWVLACLALRSIYRKSVSKEGSARDPVVLGDSVRLLSCMTQAGSPPLTSWILAPFKG